MCLAVPRGGDYETNVEDVKCLGCHEEVAIAYFQEAHYCPNCGERWEGAPPMTPKWVRRGLGWVREMRHKSEWPYGWRLRWWSKDTANPGGMAGWEYPKCITPKEALSRFKRMRGTANNVVLELVGYREQPRVALVWDGKNVWHTGGAA